MQKVFRGEVHLIDLEPIQGSEMKKTRPCVITSNDAINFNAPVIIVCPITDSYGKTSPIHIPIPDNEGGLTKKSVVHCGQIRAIDKTRLVSKLGELSTDTMLEITIGIAHALDIPQYPQVIIKA